MSNEAFLNLNADINRLLVQIRDAPPQPDDDEVYEVTEADLLPGDPRLEVQPRRVCK